MVMSHVRKLRQLVSLEQEYALRNACSSVMPVRHRSRYAAVFHTCVWKTASQWVRVIMSDPRIYPYSGLKIHIPVQSADWWPHPEALTIPERRIVPGLYCSHDRYARIPKPAAHASFFVQRDPRDILISWYFSNRYSHTLKWREVAERRQELAQLSERDGILATVDGFGAIANMLQSWATAAESDPSIMIVRYEDLTGPEKVNAWSRLLTHCDIKVPADVLGKVLDTYAFEKISGGRKPGEEDKTEKYRKGVPGDWKNYFDPGISKRFSKLYGDLPGNLGYST